MCQDRAQPIVGVRLITLQGQGSLEFGNRFGVLEVLLWPPQEKSVGDMAFGQIRIQLECPTTMKLRLLQPRACWIKFKVASGVCKRKGGMREGKGGISSDRMDQVLSGFVEQP